MYLENLTYTAPFEIKIIQYPENLTYSRAQCLKLCTKVLFGYFRWNVIRDCLWYQKIQFDFHWRYFDTKVLKSIWKQRKIVDAIFMFQFYLNLKYTFFLSKPLKNFYEYFVLKYSLYHVIPCKYYPCTNIWIFLIINKYL